MTPQQTWFSLPVPYAHRPRPAGSRRPGPGGRRRQRLLTVAAVGVGALIVVVLVGLAATGPAAADPAGADGGATTLGPAGAQRVAEAERLQLCVSGRAG